VVPGGVEAFSLDAAFFGGVAWQQVQGDASRTPEVLGAVAGMSVREREAWIRRDGKVEEQVFDDGKQKWKLKVNPDGWTASPIMRTQLSRTRSMLDRLAR
jgi:hypothetical protein